MNSVLWGDIGSSYGQGLVVHGMNAAMKDVLPELDNIPSLEGEQRTALNCYLNSLLALSLVEHCGDFVLAIGQCSSPYIGTSRMPNTVTNLLNWHLKNLIGPVSFWQTEDLSNQLGSFPCKVLPFPNVLTLFQMWNISNEFGKFSIWHVRLTVHSISAHH